MCFSQMKLAHVTQSAKTASIIMQIHASIVVQMAKTSEHSQTSPTCLGVHSFPGGAYITAADPGQHSFITPQVPAIRHTHHCDLSPRSHPPSPRPLHHNNTVAARNREPLSIVYSRSRDGLLLLWRSSIRIKLQHIAICLSLQTPIPIIKY